MKSGTIQRAKIHKKNTEHLKIWIAAIGLITLCAFFPAINGDFLNFDDDLNFTENPDYRGLRWDNIRWMFTTFHAGHYQPVTWLTSGFDYELSKLVWGDGMNPTIYHLNNILFHAVNAMLFFILAITIFEKSVPGFRAGFPGYSVAAFGTLLFSIHPMRVESVAWLTERRDVVSAMFLLLAILTYLRSIDTSGTLIRRRFVIVHAFILLGLMSKVILVVVPVIFLILDIYPLKRLNPQHRSKILPSLQALIKEKSLMLVFSFIFGVVVTRLDQVNNWLIPWSEHGLAARLMQMAYSSVFYFFKFLLPFNLRPMYEMQRPLNLTRPDLLAAVLIVLTVAGLLYWFRAKAKPLTTALVIYVVFLTPVSGLFQNGQQIVAIRYSYLSCMSLVLVLAGWLYILSRKYEKTLILKAIHIGSVLMIAVSIIATWRLSTTWKTSESLWLNAIDKCESSTYALNNYAQTLVRKQQFEAARPYLVRAIDANPANSDAFYNLGIVERFAGNKEAGLNNYKEAIRLGSQQPGLFFNTGNASMELKKFEDAIEYYSKAIEINPSYAEAHANLGDAYFETSQMDLAQSHYKKAIELNPSLIRPRFKLAQIMEHSGKPQEALRLLDEIQKIKPGDEPSSKMMQRLRSISQSMKY